MKQVNSIRTLEQLLRKATGQPDNITGGAAITAAMASEAKGHKIIYFFNLLHRASEDIKKLKEIEDIEDYIDVIIDLQDYFIIHNIWGSSWKVFKKKINDENILLVLKSLAQDFSDTYPEVSLDDNDLQSIQSEFIELLNKVQESDLSKEIKVFLMDRLEEVLLALEEYKYFGSREIELIIKSTLWSIYREQNSISKEDKNKPIWRQVLSALFGLESLLSLGIMAGTYAVPKFQSYAQKRNEYQEILETAIDLRDIPSSLNNLRALPTSKSETSEPEKPME